MERTLILVKPDAFARNLTGEIIARFERKGLRLVALQLMTMTPRARGAALRRARGQGFLRRAGGLHHLGTAGGDGARGRVGDPRRPPGDRRHQPAGGDHRARSAATTRSRWARTWSTAPTRPSRPRARSGCSSPTSASRSAAAAASLILASASPQRRAILEQIGVAFEVRVPDVDELSDGPGRRGGAGERLPQGRRRSLPPSCPCSASTPWSASARGSSASRATPSTPRRCSSALAGRTPRRRQRRVPDRRRPGAHRRRADRGGVPRRWTARRSTPTCARASGRAAPGPTPSRGAAPRWWRGSRATTSTWSGLPVPTLLDLAPELIAD